MPSYKLGSAGGEVRMIQEKLRDLGYYGLQVDGAFGGGTEAAVRAFQKDKSLAVDGQVGPKTWKALFGTTAAEPSILSKSLEYKRLALTGCFETGKGIPECFAGLSGDFGGQALSFGVLQWNFGQDSLQPLLEEMIRRHLKIVKSNFGEHFPELREALLGDKRALMAFARSIQHPAKHYIFEPWKGMFKALGCTPEFQEIEVRAAGALYRAALSLCEEYGLWSARAAALMFDIKTQNGSISKTVKTAILAKFDKLPGSLTSDPMEVEKMRIVANLQAEAANPKWIKNVRARKLCIAEGGGPVHGIPYDLKAQFGIGMDKAL